MSDEETIITLQKEIRRLRFAMRRQSPETIAHFIHFLYFIPHDFIHKIWPEKHYGTLTKHFSDKFRGIIANSDVVSPNHILRFYHELSQHHQERFCCECWDLIKTHQLYSDLFQ